MSFLLWLQENIFDPEEAPEGFKPFLKKNVPPHVGNLCRACDYRPQCVAHPFPCSPSTRVDGVSVVFKHK